MAGRYDVGLDLLGDDSIHVFDLRHRQKEFNSLDTFKESSHYVWY